LYKAGKLLFLSGMGPRTPDTNEIPGGPVRDADGNPLDYDIQAQTHSVINNVRVILEAHGSSLEDVVDVLVFLVDMERDFPGYNEVYSHYFADILHRGGHDRRGRHSAQYCESSENDTRFHRLILVCWLEYGAEVPSAQGRARHLGGCMLPGVRL